MGEAVGPGPTQVLKHLETLLSGAKNWAIATRERDRRTGACATRCVLPIDESDTSETPDSIERLNADCIDALAGLLRNNHLHLVSLDRAVRDPAYRLHDPYVGRNGIEWLERWSMELHRELPWSSFANRPPALKANYDRGDSDYAARAGPAQSAPAG